MDKEQKKLFREDALKSFSSIEELNKLLKIVKPIDWVCLISILFIIITTIAWCFLGKITSIASGEGIFLDFSKIYSLNSPATGEISQIYFNIASIVKKDEVVATVFDFKNQKYIDVKSPYNGLIVDIHANRGDNLNNNELIADLVLESTGGKEAKFYCFLPIKEGDRVRDKMRANVYLWSENKKNIKPIKAIVEKVSYFPASEVYFKEIFLNKSYYDFLTRSTQVIPVIVTPLNQEEIIEKNVLLGSFVNIEVIIETKKPISYLLPYFEKSN
ncbi:MAG: hypothetical protein HZB76_06960 [Chlamydiae bacterium]|nr:hypothetical protein [Chlamydiota bacterium]